MSIDKKQVKVVGMHCPSCAAAVEFALTDLEGVDEANANLDSGNVEIQLDCDKVSDEDIEEAVKEAGFKVE